MIIFIQKPVTVKEKIGIHVNLILVIKNFLFLWVKLSECVILDWIVPSEVQKLKAEKRGENFIDIGWYLPKRINGDLQQFVMTYQEGESGFFICIFRMAQETNIIELNLHVIGKFSTTLTNDFFSTYICWIMTDYDLYNSWIPEF